MSTRWERERSAWLKARAGHRAGIRRRSELLAARARRAERDRAGVGESAFTEVATRPHWYRSIHREDGAADTLGWIIWTIIVYAVILVAVGPALLIGLAAYALWWWQVPRWGRLLEWPYWAAAGAVAVIGGILAWIGLWIGTDGWITYAWLQLVLGLVRAGWRVRAWGWPAVARLSSAAPTAVQPVALGALDEPSGAATATATATPAAPAIQPIDLTALDD